MVPNVAAPARKLRSLLRVFGLMVVVGGAGACFDFDFDLLGPDWGSGFDFGPFPPYVTPGSARVLTGDTIRVTACKNFATCIPGTSETVSARWSVAQSTATIVGPAGFTSELDSVTNVLIRGVGPGRGRLVVTFPTSSSSIDLWVADSADIKTIGLSAPFVRFTLPIGYSQTFTASLRDAGGVDYRGRPTAWSVSDTSVLALTATTNADGATELRVDAKKEGTATLDVAFLGVTTQRTFTVIP